MSPWIAKAVVRAGLIIMAAIRLPRLYRSGSVAVLQDRRGALAMLLEAVAMLGVDGLPILWLDWPFLAFADYPLRQTPLLAGSVCLAVGLWLLHRSHVDLGANWSATLRVHRQQCLVAHGVYRHVRHPMYAAFFLCAIGHLLALPNWVAGPSSLIGFGVLFASRLRAEEAMMLDHFGRDYSTYMARTKRLIPGLW